MKIKLNFQIFFIIINLFFNYIVFERLIDLEDQMVLFEQICINSNIEYNHNNL